MMNYVASLGDRDEIQNFSLSRLSDTMVELVKGAIDFTAIAAGIVISAMGAPIAAVIAPLVLEAINVKICLEQGNNAEAVLRIIGTAVGAGIGISSIVKAGTSAFKAVAATYGDDVAKAIAQYGDDIAEIASKCGDDVAKQVDDLLKKSLDDVVEIARSTQGTGKYLGIDDWEPVKYQNGDILYRGEPNGTEFFTTLEAIDSVGASKIKMFEGLQVAPHPIYGYRAEMQGYKFVSTVNAAKAKCLANVNYGVGGLTQSFIPNANELIMQGVLVPVEKVFLKG